MSEGPANSPRRLWPPGFWYPIAESARLRGRPLGLMRFAQRIVLWRDASGRVAGFPASCPHRGADLGAGGIVDGQLECPFHGFRWAGSGRCTLTPCEGRDAAVSRRLDARPLPVTERAGLVWMWWGDPASAGGEPPWFDGLAESVVGTTTTSHEWPLSFPRMMEAILDLHHFPFVHAAFARGAGPRLDPYRAVLDGDVIHVEGRLRTESGAGPSQDFRTRVRFPAVMLSETQVPVIVLAAPVDERRVWLHLRFYPRAGLPPLAGRLYAWALKWAEVLLIFPADKRVLLPTEPALTGEDANVLVHADGAIALWYKLAARAFDAAQGGDAAGTGAEPAARASAGSSA